MYFLKYLRFLKLNRTYIFYAMAYGLSSLIIPLGVQFLVNNLALAGIWANTVTFLTLMGALLVLAQIFKHSQVVLLEYLQREMFMVEVTKWRYLKDTEHSQYYFEIFTLLKSFSKTYSDVIEIALITIFGLATIVIFHPAFLVVAGVVALTMFLIWRVFDPAFKTSILESDQKYIIYDHIVSEDGPTDEMAIEYLERRNNHFAFIKGISFKICFLHAFSQIFVIAMGCFLIEANELSVGQLVAAEIIISGIVAALLKLPRTIESFYDFETSHYKIEKALRGKIGT